MSERTAVYLQVGRKLTHAVPPDWPGWSRSGPDEDAALRALLEVAPRYAEVLRSQGLSFRPPEGVEEFEVVDRVPGNGTSEFGIPDVTLPADDDALQAAELEWSAAVLRGSWWAFDRAVDAATGKTLRRGPRGGGRPLEGVVKHVREVEVAYAKAMGVKVVPGGERSDEDEARVREELLAGLGEAAAGRIPAIGPRGGKRWLPRYFVRRLAWHELYHAWVTEDRIE